jgi:RHS repeat-associated protein
MDDPVTAWTTVSDNRYVWSGNMLAEERNNPGGGNVTKRFFAEGEQINGTNCYFSRDHLGSVREMTDSTGAVHAQYDYDPFGVRTKLSGDLDADFGFTGHYHHLPSGLNLSLYRAYSSTLGRWISRDPLKDAEMSQGANLYLYARNDPITTFDPFGLATITLEKTDGVTDWTGLFSHALGHLTHPSTGFGASGNRAAHIVFKNVCPDPRYKHLIDVKASNGWGAYKDPPTNSAFIDISTHMGLLGYFINTPVGSLDPALYVKLIATCSDDCGG